MRAVISLQAIVPAAVAAMAALGPWSPASAQGDTGAMLRLAQADSAEAGLPPLPEAAPERPAPPKPRAAPRRAPRPPPPGKIYDAMTNAERRAIQADLIWTGHYLGLVDGEFGEASLAAVKAFQKENKDKETGVLSPKQRETLATAAKSKRDEVGWRTVYDATTGAHLGLPGKLVPRSSRSGSGMRWTSARGDFAVETFRLRGINMTLAVAANQQRLVPERRIDYDVQRPDFFVMSGTQSGKKFYVRAEAKIGDVRGFTVLSDPAKDDLIERVVVAMSSAFAPFQERATAARKEGAARRKVEYSTGFVVSATGAIVAGRQATQGCQVIVVPPHGPAVRIADDRATGLALLHVYGARGIAPVPLTFAPVTSDAVTLLGIADPQEQAGGRKVSAITARLDGGEAEGRLSLQIAPVPGFSGAPALDANGRFRGVVLMEPLTGSDDEAAQPAVVPADAVRKFLGAHRVTPPTGTSGVANTRAALVRVICVRP